MSDFKPLFFGCLYLTLALIALSGCAAMPAVAYGIASGVVYYHTYNLPP